MSATQESPQTVRCSRACRTADGYSSDLVTNVIDSRRGRGSVLSRSACSASMQKLLAVAAGDESLQMGFCACDPTQPGSCKCPNVLRCIDCGVKQQLAGLVLECRSRRSFRCAGCYRPQPRDVTSFEEPVSRTNGPTFAGLLTGLAMPTASDANSYGMGFVRLSSSASAGIFRRLTVQQQQQQPVSENSFLPDSSRLNDPHLLRLPPCCATSNNEHDASDSSAVTTCCRETDDRELLSCPMPPLPPPRRPQHLPLKQCEQLAHPPLARSRSSDGHRAQAVDGVCSNSAVQSVAYKVPRVRTVSDISSLNSSAFFKPIESAVAHQPSIENGDASLGHGALPPTSFAATDVGLADFTAQAADDFDGNCSAGVRSRSDKLSRSECVSRSVSTAPAVPPSSDNVCTATDRLLRTSIMQCGVREEEEEDDNGSSTSGHTISAPLWHSWSGQELCNRLNGGTSKRNCNSKPCSRTTGQAHSGTETKDVSACDSAISANGKNRVIRDTAAPFGRQATATLSYAADSHCESLCFATYKPPLSTTIAERRDFGSSTSLRRATLRLSGTSMDGSLGREADSASSSPAVSPTATVSQRQLSQHRSADCLDQLDTYFGAPAVWQPAAGAGHRQVLLSHGRGSPEAGKLSPTTRRSEAASAVVLRHDSDSNGQSGVPVDAVVRNDPVPEHSALTAAVLGKSDWYTDCGKGVTTPDLPSSPLRWPGKARTSSVDALDRTPLLDRAKSGCGLSAPGTPCVAIEGSSLGFAGVACSHLPIDYRRDNERVLDVAAVSPTSTVTAPVTADKETIAIATTTSGRTAAVQTAPSAQVSDCHASSSEPSLQPGPGHLARLRRAVPRTNPHVFHRNVASGSESSDSSHRTAVSRHCCWSRVLSDSCLVWPKVPTSALVPASSPISSSDLSAAAVAGAAIIATICDHHNERQYLRENCNASMTTGGDSRCGNSDQSGSRKGAAGASTDCGDSSDDILSWPDFCGVGLVTSADDRRHCRRLTEGESYV